MLDLDRGDWALLVLGILCICYFIICLFMLDFYALLASFLAAIVVTAVAARLGVAIEWLVMIFLTIFLFFTTLMFIVTYTPLKGIVAFVVAVVVDVVVIVTILYIIGSVLPPKEDKARAQEKRKEPKAWELEDQLKELKEQVSRGAITQEEYEQKKKKLLEKS